MKMKLAMILCTLLVSGATLSHATQITVDFTGAIYTVGSGVAGYGVNVGDGVTGQFIYDDASPAIISAGTSASYSGQNFSVEFQSGFSASSSTVSVSTYNEAWGDFQLFDGMWVGGSSVTGDTLNGRSVNTFAFGLGRYGYNSLLPDLLPDDSLLDSTDWANVSLADVNTPDFHWMQFASDTPQDAQIRWDITSFSVTSGAAPVPEPSTILLLASGLLGLGWYGRKRKKV